ncbi:hypothetical protein pdam_00011715 [Pocillopora damicornis]|uniref:Uncharacterized protein n=1 Tax=Pocillopora damicornis TaxID=46731 RepID=A0A3M6T7T8_POCDA|nr:hypothetical protein pdam_00011715 [Pocillopora damicornis]
MRKQKTWYCPHYSRLPQFKRRGGTRTSAQPSMASIQAAMKLDNICICKAKPSTTETVVECHGDNYSLPSSHAIRSSVKASSFPLLLVFSSSVEVLG